MTAIMLVVAVVCIGLAKALDWLTRDRPQTDYVSPGWLRARIRERRDS